MIYHTQHMWQRSYDIKEPRQSWRVYWPLLQSRLGQQAFAATQRKKHNAPPK